MSGWLYSPEDLHPPASLRLLARSTGTPERMSNAELEASEARIQVAASWLELALPPQVLVFVLLVVAAVWFAFRVGA